MFPTLYRPEESTHYDTYNKPPTNPPQRQTLDKILGAGFKSIKLNDDFTNEEFGDTKPG